MTKTYTTSVEYGHIDVALKSFWKPFSELLDEMILFVPQPLSAFDDRRKILSEEIRKLNPEMPSDEIYNHAAKDIIALADPNMQFWIKFDSRFMTLLVTITLLSQALCEAIINVILATGLHEHGNIEHFKKIEKNSIRKKWLEAPKTFCSAYLFNKDTELYVTLNHLIEERNSWMHHKSYLQVEDKTVIEGSKLSIHSYTDAANWIKRYFSLPYDLAAHAFSQTHSHVALILVYDRQPIPIADAHK